MSAGPKLNLKGTNWYGYHMGSKAENRPEHSEEDFLHESQ